MLIEFVLKIVTMMFYLFAGNDRGNYGGDRGGGYNDRGNYSGDRGGSYNDRGGYNRGMRGYVLIFNKLFCLQGPFVIEETQDIHVVKLLTVFLVKKIQLSL